MNNEQLNLLDHALAEIEQLRTQQSMSVNRPLAMPTPMMAKRLGVSSSTLNRAKQKGDYQCSVDGKFISVQWVYQQNNRDYWIAIEVG